MNQSSLTQYDGLRIAFLQARWHADIVDQCRMSFVDEISRATNGAADVKVFDVPGAFELPLQARMIARTHRFAAVVASAFVVDGGIYRHDFVADTVVVRPDAGADGCRRAGALRRAHAAPFPRDGGAQGVLPRPLQAKGT